ncbi:hypothetical protein [Sinobaca sp. H24]|uniref:hypothetical protein n=1 Tax=Sinobaca sp. H24 TaxID=2923376 RepID=UPI0035B470B2
MLIVLFIVLIGVVFDMVGVAATAAEEKPFHAMAAKKVPGAYQSMVITRNADKVANFCADVIGDISGVVSGAATSAVVIQLAVVLGSQDGSTLQAVLNVVFTAIVAALTVGGKALGKTFAIQFSTNIIFQVGKFFYVMETKFKLRIFSKKQKKKKA